MGHAHTGPRVGPQGTSRHEQAHTRAVCRRNRQVEGDITAIANQAELHLERQFRRFCEVHALNALFGRRIVSPTAMADFCRQELQFNTALGRHLRMLDLADGNLSTMVVNAWLHHHSSPAVRLVSITLNVAAGSAAEDSLSALPPGHDAFQIYWTHGKEAHNSSNYGHVVCVRKQAHTGGWYLLDSENSQPTKMTQIERSHLRGNVRIH